MKIVLPSWGWDWFQGINGRPTPNPTAMRTPAIIENKIAAIMAILLQVKKGSCRTVTSRMLLKSPLAKTLGSFSPSIRFSSIE